MGNFMFGTFKFSAPTFVNSRFRFSPKNPVYLKITRPVKFSTTVKAKTLFADLSLSFTLLTHKPMK